MVGSAAQLAACAILAAAGCTSDLDRRFEGHIAYLASDELGGRGVGTPGIDLAAEYVAGEFKEIGLEPAGDSGTYFQTFPITLSPTLTDGGRLAFSGDTTPRKQGTDFIPFNFSSGDSFSGGVAFCGYGIINPGKSHNDFKDLDLTGQAAIIIAGEPPSWADADGTPTSFAMHRDKIYNAKDRGAVAVLIVNPRPTEGNADRLPEFVSEGADAYGIPAFHITRALADSVLQRGGLASLDGLQKKLDEGQFASGIAAHITVEGQAGIQRATASARNVLGKWPGAGPHKDEFVIIGAHYDHLGLRRPMMRKFKGGKLVAEEIAPQIHNGADDNASGTSGLIEIARMFADGPQTDRSILFIAFSAEESGLHGSKYYVDHPLVPLGKSVAMLNMDMIGRLKPGENRVTVFGVDCGKGFPEVVNSAAGSARLTVAPAIDEGGRSDHASFIRKNVPSMHFFSGNHSDYHQPSDDTDKINVRGGTRIARLVYETARELASRESRPQYVEVKREKKDQPRTTTFRVVMGLTPNYSEDGRPGMLVDAVSSEGPAEVAGMKAGDRILRINNKPIANVYDYMASTRGNKAGDTVEVVVSREGKEIALKVTLAGAR